MTQPRDSHLFTVRIWGEESGPQKRPWRGKVQHVPSGAWHYFRDWEGMVTFMQTQLAELDEAECTQP